MMGKPRPLGERGENKGLNLSLLLLLTTTATFGAGPELLLTGSLRPEREMACVTEDKTLILLCMSR